ncbi:peptide deformylase [Candidatus Oleimmundimicrobium sp.]|uniref:peptide deformylase n=1 Tax=Candidatus Oleimmundimicrobium sp. TaxID=3060597 RepID=UPI002720B509|nr:peptide deformylase [Candidatus Oleimmundimicrobium sp.]MDO8885380.1 peptide deformylase [Candidatus Oleimmundimicrobium sp.]
MTVLKIREFGDPGLKEKCHKIVVGKQNLNELIKNMADTMYGAPGVGLSAPQVGILEQLFIYDVGDGLQVYINPKIVAVEGEDIDEEGCLSIPNIQVPVKRAKKVKISTLNAKGKNVTFVADGLLARVIQHEIDHLNGILILDKTDVANRRNALMELSKKIEID